MVNSSRKMIRKQASPNQNNLQNRIIASLKKDHRPKEIRMIKMAATVRVNLRIIILH